MPLNISSTHGTVNTLLKQLNFPQLLKLKIKEGHYRLSVLSQQMGRDPSYMQRRINDYDQPVSIIILLSLALQANLFEPFLNLLPENIRITQKETELQAQITTLQNQLADLGKERDIYKNIVMQNR